MPRGACFLEDGRLVAPSGCAPERFPDSVVWGTMLGVELISFPFQEGSHQAAGFVGFECAAE